MPRKTRTSGPTTPKNLKELRGGNREGYQIKTVYFLELEHGLMGFFPAIIGDEKRMVLALDPQLLHKVWKTLSPRRSKMGSQLFYVNEGIMIGFPIFGESAYDQERSEPHRLLSEQEFATLATANPCPFRWAPGLVGDDMSEEEFLQTLHAAAEQHGVALPTTA